MMKKNSLSIWIKLLVLVVILWLASACHASAKEYRCAANTESAQYNVIFKATWDAETHPTDFPSGAHFSGLIGATHNSTVSFWKRGEISSAGMKEMAEIGTKTALQKEIDRATYQGNAKTLISGSSFSSPGSHEVNFSICSSHSFVTLVSMLAPSPDWFVGVRNLNLYENNTWVETKTIELFVYDAGTDSGPHFTSANQETNPKEPIVRLGGDFKNTPIGTFTFIKQ